jgi:hypothetical protein
MKTPQPLLAILLQPLMLLASGQAFRFERPVQPTGRGPQRLEVDLALLGGAGPGLRDLRLLDPEGREVPYVLVPPAPGEAVWRQGRLLPIPPTRVSSGFELDLGAAVTTARVRIEGLQAPFLKRFRLEGSGDRARWTELVREGTLFDLPDEHLAQRQIDIPEGSYRYLRLTWNDRDSARVTLPDSASVEVEAPGSSPSLTWLPVERRTSEPGISRFKVRLPGPRLPLVALRLVVAGSGPLLREAVVLEGRLQGWGLEPRELGKALLRRVARQGLSAADLRIPVESPEGTELELRVADGNNPPLELAGVEVELPPQPWIYFESDGRPGVARYGNAGLEPPRYDLEALKDQLGAAHAAPARWGAPAAPGGVPGDGRLFDPGPGAVLEHPDLPVRRAIPDASPGLASLALDAHVLAHSRQLRDLRILDPQGRQVPYLLERCDAPLGLALAVPPRGGKGRLSEYVFELPEAGLQEGRLVLETRTRVFRRTVALAEAGGGAREGRWMGGATWSHAQADADPEPLELSFAGLPGRQLRLTVDEGDNQPLLLSRATLLLPGWRLRFFHPGHGLALLYGRELRPPEYDLALLADRLRGAPAQDLVLPAGALPVTAEPEPAPKASKVFWIALSAVVVLLLAFLARLLRRPAEGPPAIGG